MGPAALLPLLFLLGCAARGPADTARRYLELVERGNYSAAYALLGPAFRERCDLPCFSRLAQEQRADARELLKQAVVKVEERAELDLGEAGTLSFRRSRQPDRGAWLLSGDPLDFYPQDTPPRALGSFVRAVTRRRYAVALRFVPPKLRRDVTLERLREAWEGAGREALLKQVEAVRRHLAEPFVIDGKEARLPLADRKEARLLAEDGRWYVLELE